MYWRRQIPSLNSIQGDQRGALDAKLERETGLETSREVNRETLPDGVRRRYTIGTVSDEI
jgi:hypothetical protein